MERIKYRVSLDMFDVVNQTTIKAKKGDTACSVYITLTENGKVYNITEGCSAVFSGKKSDGNYLFNSETCRIEGNTIVYDFTSQTTAREGLVECEVILYKGKDRLTSARFNLMVDATIYNGEEIISTPEADALNELIEEADKAVAKFVSQTTLVSNALKGNASGSAVALKGVSPLEHEIKVQLSKKAEMKPLSDLSGLDDFYFAEDTGLYLVEKKTVSGLTCNIEFVGDSYIVYTDYDGLHTLFGEGDTLYWDNNNMILYLPAGSGDSFDFSSVTLTKFGKNLFTCNDVIDSRYNTSYDKVTQLVTISSAYGVGTIYKIPKPIPAGVKVSITAKIISGVVTSKNNSMSIGGYHSETGGNSWQGNITFPNVTEKDFSGQTLSETFVTTDTVNEFIIYTPTAHCTIHQPLVMLIQYEIGDPTEFELYKSETETVTVNADGTASIIGNGESMTLITDVAGVTIEAEYNRDINKAFAELLAKIEG